MPQHFESTKNSTRWTVEWNLTLRKLCIHNLFSRDKSKLNEAPRRPPWKMEKV